MATVIVFTSSFSITSFLVLIKAIELKNNKKNILLRLINRLDSRLNKLVSFLKFKSLQLIQSIRYIILVEAKEVAEDLFYGAREKILNEYKIRQNMIMGRKEVISNGSVSFFLRHITENKDNREKGKIQNSL
jgi:hypothetical protein